MGQHWPKTGPNYAPAYQVSGIPFVTSSLINEVPGIDLNSASPEPISVTFPFVTKYVTVRNIGANELRVGFSKRGMFAPGERLPSTLGGGQKGLLTADDHRNFFLIPSASATKAQNPDTFGTVVKLDVRCKEIFFMSDAAHNTPASAHATGFSLIAGLTTIPSSEFPILTASLDGTSSFEGIG